MVGQTIPHSGSSIIAAEPALPHVPNMSSLSPPNPSISYRARFISAKARALGPISHLHSRTIYLRHVPLSVLLIIVLLVVVNILVWVICALVILLHQPSLASTAAIAYTLGLRHALDADHISAIDLMTRRLIASGQRPVTVGTFFSLGHSTIVLITCIVVAATAAGVSKRFDGISTVGSIIGSAASASFLILLGLMNAYILYRLIVQLRKVLHMHPNQSQSEAWKIEGGGPLFRVLKKLFHIIDRPWKMYPVGVIFGLGFDTSSEIALLGISSIQGAKGTNIWLILIFPILFTSGMCLVDTIDGALMMALYVKPMEMYGELKDDEIPVEEGDGEAERVDEAGIDHDTLPQNTPPPSDEDHRHVIPSQELRTVSDRATQRAKDPIAFLYYSTILTSLTVVVALVIGTIQLLTMILNVAYPSGPHDNFWEGVAATSDNWEIIGGSICGCFVVVGLASVFAYKPWRRWVEGRREERFRQGPSVGVEDGNRELTTLGTAGRMLLVERPENKNSS